MEYLMMKKNIKMKSAIKYIVLLALGILLSTSCTKDFEEINTNPHGFTTASTGSLFNGIVQSLVPPGNVDMYINNEVLFAETQQAALTGKAWGNFTIGTEAMWTNYYRALGNIRELEKRLSLEEESPELTNIRAMLKITLAYKTFVLTDIFGDIPYSTAGFGFQDLNYLRPIYDSQKDIYLSLLDDLKWCDENIDLEATELEPFKTFKSFDPLFRGDLVNWQKLANSLRLRYAMRMSDKEPQLAGEIILDIVDNKRPIYVGYEIIYIGESAHMEPGAMGFSNTGLEWAMREHKHLRLGSNVWSQVSYHDSTDGSGIFDPRAYIFFEGNNLNEWVVYPQIADANTPAPGGIPYASHRDALTGYDIKGATCIYSPINYFINGDYKHMPIPIITGAEVHFILAEAYLRGIGLAANPSLADIEYMNGINSSVEWWIEISNGSSLPLSGIRFTDKIVIPSGLGASSVLGVFGSWNAGTDEEKLEFLYTQRWLDAMMQPQEAYALARRTNMTPREGEDINHFRMPYPPSEQEFNTENWLKAKDNQGGSDEPNSKIWWVPN